LKIFTKIKISLLLKLIIPVVLLVYIFRSQARFLEVVQNFKNCQIEYLLFALSLLLITRFQVAIRLYFLASNYIKSNILLILKDVFIANLLNTILPTGSGEIYRIKSLAGDRQSIFKSTALVTLDRFFGMLSILTISTFSMLFSTIYFQGNNISNIAYFLIVLISVFFLVGMALNKIELNNKFFRDIKIFFTFMHDYPFKAVLLYVYSIFITLTLIISIFFIVISLDINIPFLNFLQYYPLVLVVSVLPISIGGLGVREIANITAFGPLGIPNEQCVSLGLMQYALMLAVSAIGFILFIVSLNHK
jgi:uncharacterized membrane protein YbhN (UPF0104 family)